jgi:hypothetical protein
VSRQARTALGAHFTSAHVAEFGAALGGPGLRGMDVKRCVVGSEGSVP